jgi:hypothetical protein
MGEISLFGSASKKKGKGGKLEVEPPSEEKPTIPGEVNKG